MRHRVALERESSGIRGEGGESFGPFLHRGRDVVDSRKGPASCVGDDRHHSPVGAVGQKASRVWSECISSYALLRAFRCGDWFPSTDKSALRLRPRACRKNKDCDGCSRNSLLHQALLQKKPKHHSEALPTEGSDRSSFKETFSQTSAMWQQELLRRWLGFGDRFCRACLASCANKEWRSR